MRTVDRNQQRYAVKTTVLLMSLFLCLSLSRLAEGQAEGQQTFGSSRQAVDALIQSLRNGDNTTLQAILGPGSEQIVSSGDAVADNATRSGFLKKYDSKHSLVESGPHQLTLEVGKDYWPLPIPLVHKGGEWFFDGAAGKRELLYRRIGRNELAAISVCHGFISAQKEYAATGHDGSPAGAYASKLVSDPGKQNGLYWKVTGGETPSPAGPFLARASMEGYSQVTGSGSQLSPYHGYYYRVLAQQGSAAKGGARDYYVDGRLTGGVALIAYPAEYRSSGVMSFIVNQNGVVYQKDLGENTAEIARGISEYNPDSTWTRVK